MLVVSRRERVQASLAVLAEQSQAAAKGELGDLEDADSGDLTSSHTSAATSPGSTVHGANSGAALWLGTSPQPSLTVQHALEGTY